MVVPGAGQPVRAGQVRCRPRSAAAALTSWLAAQSPQFRAQVEVVAMDGFGGYKTAATDQLPEATTVMDPLCRGPDYADVGWVGAGHGGGAAGEVGIIRGSGGRSSGRRRVACIGRAGFRWAWCGSGRFPSWSCRREGKPGWFRCFEPSQSAMTVLSIPAVSSRIAAVCLSTWGDILGGQAGAYIVAVAVCCASRAATASRLIRVPVRAGEYESFSVTWLFGDECRQDFAACR